MSPEEKLQQLGITLPEPVAPVAAYVPAARTGNLVFISGQVPVRDGRAAFTGKVGAEVDLDTAKEAAQLCAINGLAALRGEIGDLGRVVRVVRLGVFVASAEGFTQQPAVGNGASELMIEVFGDAGKHARAAVGVAELPFGVPVEVEFVFEVS